MIHPRDVYKDARAWANGLGVYGRRRLALAVALAVAGLVVGLILIFTGGSGAGRVDPRTLVPAGSKFYAELDTDPSSAEVQNARSFAARLPLLSRQVVDRTTTGLLALRAAGAVGGAHREAWLGDQAAVARSPAGEVELLATDNSAAAFEFARKLLRSPANTRYRGIEVAQGKRASAAVVEGYLAFGDDDAVRRTIDLAAGDSTSLAEQARVERALGTLPATALVRGYLAGSVVRTLGPLAGPDASAVVALDLGADAVELEVRATASSQGEPAPKILNSFTPSLPHTLAEGTLAYLGVGRLSAPEGRLIAAAGSRLPRLVTAAAARLGITHLVELVRVLVPALGEETAVAVTPGPAARAGRFAAPPTIGLVSSGVDEDAAVEALRKLGSELAGELRGDSLLLAGNARALARLAEPKGSLTSSPTYRRATHGLDADPAVAGYLDLGGLVPLFEAAGLAENPAYASFAAEIRRLEGLGVTIDQAQRSLELRLRLTLTGK